MNDEIIELVRLAQSLEAGGIYNAAKLLWAAAFSEEIRASRVQSLPIQTAERDHDLTHAIEMLAARGFKSDFIAALKRGQAGARENRTITLEEIPPVRVCRACGELMLGELFERCPNCGARALAFREFPPIFFLEPLEPRQALLELEKGPDQVEAAIHGLSAEQMDQTPAPGEWAISYVLLHILIAQSLLAGRVPKMLAEENPSLQGVAAWNIGSEEKLGALEIVQRYRTSRAETVERLKKISAQDWWRTAQHEEFGTVTILQQASYFCKHERQHLPQIDAIRRSRGT